MKTNELIISTILLIFLMLYLCHFLNLYYGFYIVRTTCFTAYAEEDRTYLNCACEGKESDCAIFFDLINQTGGSGQ